MDLFEVIPSSPLSNGISLSKIISGLLHLCQRRVRWAGDLQCPLPQWNHFQPKPFQAFHICANDGSGGRVTYSVLCPSGTIFNQNHFRPSTSVPTTGQAAG